MRGDKIDAAVIGGGASGLVAALSLAAADIPVLLVAPRTTERDRRTSALMAGSIEGLAPLGTWAEIAAHAAPLKRARIVDATRRLFRAPETVFDAAELGLDAFGYNIENWRLVEALTAAIEHSNLIDWHASPLRSVTFGHDGAELQLASGARGVRVVLAADGRNSLCRGAAEIAMQLRILPQTAIALNLSHARPHHDTLTEFHTEAGPFTLVPLVGHRSSLVWVEDTDEAAALLELDDDALAAEAERRAHSILGKMQIEGPPAAFPLSSALAERFAVHRLLLIGEAGHQLPPIGAQGLNLGIRDAATAAALVAAALREGRDPGGVWVTDQYERDRRADVVPRALAVDWMNRSLLSDFLPMQIAKGVGLGLAARIGWARRALMRVGLGKSATLR